MGKGGNDKFRLVYLIDIFEKSSDEEHPISIREISKKLDALGVSSSRQTLYKDIEDLKSIGYDIVCVKKEGRYGYYLSGRTFDLAELKLMVDAVQSARFITGVNNGALIDKIGTLTSTYRAGQLKRQVYVADRGGDYGREIYENIDRIHEAIYCKVRIRYKYYEWSADKVKVARHSGNYYTATPIALIWDSENYYLVAYDAEADNIKHFRVDKLGRVYLTNEKADENDKIACLDLAKYSSQVFGMYGGDSELVTLVCENSLAGVVIDKFGQQVTFFKEDEKRFSVRVRVMLSPNFFSWVFMFGGRIEIKSPDNVVKKYVDTLCDILERYTKMSDSEKM